MQKIILIVGITLIIIAIAWPLKDKIKRKNKDIKLEPENEENKIEENISEENDNNSNLL